MTDDVGVRTRPWSGASGSLTGIARSELLKMATHPVCVGGIVLMLVLTVALGIGSVTASNEFDWTQGLSRAAMVGQFGAVILAAAVFGQEFDGANLRTTYLCIPRRSRVLGVKLALCSVTVAACCLLWSLPMSAARMVWAGPGAEDAWTMLARCGGFTLTWVLMAAVSFGLSLVLGSLVVTIAILIPLMLGVSQVVYVLTDLARFLPDLAGYRLINSDLSAMLPPALGAAVQAIWAVALVGWGAWRLHRRDVR